MLINQAADWLLYARGAVSRLQHEPRRHESHASMWIRSDSSRMFYVTSYVIVCDLFELHRQINQYQLLQCYVVVSMDIM